MPSFRGHVEMVEAWRAFPGLGSVPEAARAQENAVALTFDDGPDPDATPAVLDALAAEGLRATFFVVGEQIDAHPELLRRIVEGGHELACHGESHRAHPELDDQEAAREVAESLARLESAAGTTPRWFRPPYGVFSADSYAACQQAGLAAAYWSSWGMDPEPIPSARIAELVCRDLIAGDVILLHDSPRYAWRPSALPTAEAIPEIAACARELGVDLMPLGDAALSAPATDPLPAAARPAG